MLTARGETLELSTGRRVGVLVRGPIDGSPVVYVHGWPGSRLEQLVIPDDALARHGVRLIAVDRPGYGDTDPWSGTRAERMADVLGVCDALGVDRFSAMGVSCGGSNVVALAASAPERVTHLVLVSAQMPYDDESALATMDPEQLEELPTARLGRTDELVAGEEAYRLRLIEHGAGLILDGEGFSEPERRWMAEGSPARAALEADIREAVRVGSEGLLEDFLMSVQSFEFGLDAVQCPVYAVHGGADNWEPLANLRRFLVQLGSSQLILLEDMGHLGPLLHPDLLLSLAVDRSNADRSP